MAMEVHLEGIELVAGYTLVACCFFIPLISLFGIMQRRFQKEKAVTFFEDDLRASPAHTRLQTNVPAQQSQVHDADAGALITRSPALEKSTGSDNDGVLFDGVRARETDAGFAHMRFCADPEGTNVATGAKRIRGEVEFYKSFC